jgi:hypothetical protein
VAAIVIDDASPLIALARMNGSVVAGVEHLASKGLA